MDDDDERPSKRFRSDLHIDMRMLLPSKVAGAIIGKGGENIKRLRTDYKASISVPDSRGPERILSVSANVDVVCAIMRDVIPTISQQMNRAEDDDHEIRVLIHQSHAGRVIGKGGTRIKELREETGSQIKIYMDCAPYSSERVVQITGSARQITGCIGAMYETMEGVPPKGANMPYNPNNFDQFNSTSYGGYTDDRGGRRGPRDMRINQANSGLAGGLGGFGGGSGRFGDPSNRGGSSMGGMSGYMHSRTGGNTDKVTTSQVSIPKGLAGAILGKGGNRIKQVQSESGTKIKLDDASPDSAERIISITGTQEQIQYAQYLLQMTVKRHSGASP